MSSGAAQLPSHRGGRVGAAEPSWGAAPQTRHPSEVCAAQPAVAVVVAVQDVRTPATPFVALSASAVRHADRRPSNWSGGRPLSRRPVSTRPG
jgi:hypothetical protein